MLVYAILAVQIKICIIRSLFDIHSLKGSSLSTLTSGMHTDIRTVIESTLHKKRTFSAVNSHRNQTGCMCALYICM